jgi:CDP-glucose 4,6-dehydratase
MGANVHGIALPPQTSPDLFTLAEVKNLCTSHLCDIRDHEKFSAILKKAAPEIVFHMAAQPLVRASYLDPLATFSTNVQGTAHVLDAVRSVGSVRAVVVITTDKVYRNLENERPHIESDELGGYDPYSASKAAAEFVVSSYRDSFLAEKGTAVASARAGNVIGGGDWSPDRLLPDAVNAWESNRKLVVRRPDAVRPWQHVLEPLAGYLALAESIWENPSLSGSYNFGPNPDGTATVRNVIEIAQNFFGKGETVWEKEESGPVETGFLALDASKARRCLEVVPRWSLNGSIRRTMDWYRSLRGGADAQRLCLADIADFESFATGETE